MLSENVEGKKKKLHSRLNFFSNVGESNTQQERTQLTDSKSGSLSLPTSRLSVNKSVVLSSQCYADGWQYTYPRRFETERRK